MDAKLADHSKIALTPDFHIRSGKHFPRPIEVLMQLRDEMIQMSTLFTLAQCDFKIPVSAIKLSEAEQSLFVYMETSGHLLRERQALAWPDCIINAGFLVHYVPPGPQTPECLSVTVQPVNGFSPIDARAEEIFTPVNQAGLAIAWRLKNWANPETLHKIARFLGTAPSGQAAPLQRLSLWQ